MRGDRIVTALIQTVEFRNFREAAIRSTDGRFTVSATRARVAYVSYVPGGADRMAQTDWWRHGKRPKKPLRQKIGAGLSQTGARLDFGRFDRHYTPRPLKRAD